MKRERERERERARERGRAGVAAYLLCQLLLSRLVAAHFLVSLQGYTILYTVVNDNTFRLGWVIYKVIKYRGNL